MYRLRWESTANIVDLSHVFRNFRQNEELFDVKLGCSVSDGGATSMKAHKLVLSAYSSVFKDTFYQLKNNRDPFVYLKGVSQDSLSSILDFMYNGSVDIPKSSMEQFLSDAQDLQIKGLKFYNDATTTNDVTDIGSQKTINTSPTTPLRTKKSPKKMNKVIKTEKETSVMLHGTEDQDTFKFPGLTEPRFNSLKKVRRPIKKIKLQPVDDDIDSGYESMDPDDRCVLSASKKRYFSRANFVRKRF